MTQQSPDRIALLESRVAVLEARLADDHLPQCQDFKTFLARAAGRIEAEWRKEINALSKVHTRWKNDLDPHIQEYLDEITKDPVDQLDFEGLVRRIKELTEFHRVRLGHLPVLRY